MSKALEEFNDEELKPSLVAPPIVPANFLDALPHSDAEPANNGDGNYISAVNSDDNGLYRMFLTVSP